MSNKDLKIGSNRSFGIVFAIVFVLIAFWPLLNGNEIRIWAILASLIFFILGLLNSKLLGPLNRIWFKFGIILGKYISPIIMAIIFFFVVTPTGLIMRLFRKDLINLNKTNQKTYWIEKKDIKSSMKNQF